MVASSLLYLYNCYLACEIYIHIYLIVDLYKWVRGRHDSGLKCISLARGTNAKGHKAECG